MLHESETDFERVHFCPDGSCIVASAPGGHWWLFSGDGKLRRHEELSGNVSGVTFDPRGQRFAIGTNDGHVRLWFTGSGEPASAGMSYPSAISDLQFDATGNRLALANETGEVRVLSLQSPTSEKRLDHPQAVTALSFDTTGKLLATATEDGAIRIWDIQSSMVVSSPESPGATIARLAFSANDQRLVVIPRAEPWIALCAIRTREVQPIDEE